MARARGSGTEIATCLHPRRPLRMLGRGSHTLPTEQCETDYSPRPVPVDSWAWGTAADGPPGRRRRLCGAPAHCPARTQREHVPRYVLHPLREGVPACDRHEALRDVERLRTGIAAPRLEHGPVRTASAQPPQPGSQDRSTTAPPAEGSARAQAGFDTAGWCRLDWGSAVSTAPHHLKGAEGMKAFRFTSGSTGITRGRMLSAAG